MKKLTMVASAILLSSLLTGCGSGEGGDAPATPVTPPAPTPDAPVYQTGLEVRPLFGGLESYWEGSEGETASSGYVYYRVINHDEDTKGIRIGLYEDFDGAEIVNNNPTGNTQCGDYIDGHSTCDITVKLEDSYAPSGTQKSLTVSVEDETDGAVYYSDTQTTTVDANVVVNADVERPFTDRINDVEDYYEIGKTYRVGYALKVKGDVTNVNADINFFRVDSFTNEKTSMVNKTFIDNTCQQVDNSYGETTCYVTYDIKPNESGPVSIEFQHSWYDKQSGQSKTSIKKVKRSILGLPQRLEQVNIYGSQQTYTLVDDMKTIFGNETYDFRHSFLLTNEHDGNIQFDEKDAKETWQRLGDTHIKIRNHNVSLAQHIDGQTYSLNTAAPSTNVPYEDGRHLTLIFEDDIEGDYNLNVVNIRLIDKTYNGTYNRIIEIPLVF